MTKLKLDVPADHRPVKLTLELPAPIHRDLVAYGEILGSDTGAAIEPAKLIAPMLEQFMASDREFIRAKGQWDPRGK